MSTESGGHFGRIRTRILVLNPNSSSAMTAGLAEAIENMELYPHTELDTYTAPQESPQSINDGADVLKSAEVVSRDLAEKAILKDYDAALVACYSVHPLVGRLAGMQGKSDGLVVTGIFEASILTCLSLLPPHRKWGIVTTGKYWEEHLAQGVNAFLGTEPPSPNARFAGVETTGLNAGDFHGGVGQDVIRQKLRDATRKLLAKGNVECVVMGCAGMAGLEEIIRSVAIEEYGPVTGNQLLVVDGVRAGIRLLEQMVRNREAFRRT